MKNTVTCPVCGEELNLKNTVQIVRHMEIDEAHCDHKLKIEMDAMTQPVPLSEIIPE